MNIKKVAFITFMISISYTYAQILDYNQMGALFTPQQQVNTARSMGVKCAFGALGSDLISMDINPAGVGAFQNSMAALTLGYDGKSVESEFYKGKQDNSEENFLFGQIGAVLNFDVNGADGVKAINFAFNYNALGKFENVWGATGLELTTIEQDPSDSNIIYDKVVNQTYRNIASGSHTQASIGGAVNVDDKWFIGATINSREINYTEKAIRDESSESTATGESYNIHEEFWQEVNGDGVSFGIGVILKPIQNIRLGLSYTTPVWYAMSDSSNMIKEDNNDALGYYEITYSTDPNNPEFNAINKVTEYDYELRTPSKLTGSLAFIFGKYGLISVDASRQNVKNIKYSPVSEFINEEDIFDEYYKPIYQINTGTEWRVENLSLRGGFSYTTTPYVNHIDSDNLMGYSLGLGYKFGRVVLDVAYDYSRNTDYANIYADLGSNANIDGVELTKTNSKGVVTLSYYF